VWFDKQHPCATFLDISTDVKPDVVADSRHIPLPDNSYDLAVFDPPHVNTGAKSKLSRLSYGHYTTLQIRDIISRSSQELSRVVKADGLLAFKWSNHDQKLSTILALMPLWEPLFGHKVSQRNLRASQTYWVMLRNAKEKL
jgi:hypothetical protein